VGHKKRAPKLLSLTLTIINWFWSGLHCINQKGAGHLRV